MTRADEWTPGDATEAVVLAYFTLLMQRDLDGFEALWHEDAVQEIPFLPEGFGAFVTPCFEGCGAIMAHYRAAFANRRDHVFSISAVHRVAEAETVIVEAQARSLVGETGRIYENRYVCVFELRDGRIERLREYVDPLAFTRAFAGSFDDYR
ncbi:MAG: nuclear transport factor 2 family protein [Rhizobiaceae bacterium]|nr:nuclear transport factor 2 family protein [Rhizobiaceae bacterium]MCV0404899.1 nuclear transport factor 2 family protein [Rhizobiaceae bacterium]